VHSEVEGLLSSSAALPFIEAISRNQAPSAREGISKGGLVGNRLRPRIDRTKADFGIVGPGRDQTPIAPEKSGVLASIDPAE